MKILSFLDRLLIFSLLLLGPLVGWGLDLPLKWTKIADERNWITHSYLPSCFGKTLYIGVGSYTVQYPYYTPNPSLFETIDYLEERAQFGSPFCHHVGDILDFQPDHLYDHVSFFGILGYHFNKEEHLQKYAPFVTEESIRQVLDKIDRLLAIGGRLQIGANYYDVGPYTIDFWTDLFDKQYGQKYKPLSIYLSPLSIIWIGKKLKQ